MKMKRYAVISYYYYNECGWKVNFCHTLKEAKIIFNNKRGLAQEIQIAKILHIKSLAN